VRDLFAYLIVKAGYMLCLLMKIKAKKGYFIMARIKTEDLPKDMKISKEDTKVSNNRISPETPLTHCSTELNIFVAAKDHTFFNAFKDESKQNSKGVDS